MIRGDVMTRNTRSDLFATDAQPDLFGAEAIPAYRPDPDKVRARLTGFLPRRGRQRHFLGANDVSLYRTIFRR